ncbi:hypothetical protein K4749_40525 [Streptomyces sp. TRM72054]|uniref:hypothetical protein n=1 Tax=Streptomyces sp. TRM72054 TaxID=2870562 RepID=UPI001C8C0625|nr:hypothetical protein [Streptomyces sp. TRM72054]MBX9399618.1 hypothetical protein [Streptomyces sp. TRM72054]
MAAVASVAGTIAVGVVLGDHLWLIALLLAGGLLAAELVGQLGSESAMTTYMASSGFVVGAAQATESVGEVVRWSLLGAGVVGGVDRNRGLVECHGEKTECGG